MDTLPAALSAPKGPESLFFAGPKKSDSVAYGDRKRRRQSSAITPCSS